MRCGALATSTSTRTSSGATFYGIMEMSGNAAELTIIAEGTGRTYTGLHGDGALSVTAEANTANWTTNATNQFNVLFRGGDFFGSSALLQVSARNGTNVFDNGAANTFLGGRGVRTGE